MRPLVIRRIDLRKAPGFPSGRFPSLPDFSSGLNLVRGPNGSGKTTLSEALRRTLWNVGKDGFEAEAVALAEGRSFNLSLNGKTLIQYDPNGGAGLPDSTGAEASLNSFPLVDLLQSAEDGSAFAAKVKSELLFGVDLEKAAVEAGRKTAFSTPTNAVKAFREARGNLRSLCDAQKRGAEDKNRLDGLKKEIDGLPLLERKLALLQKAIKLKENLEELQKLLDAEKSYPEAMKNLTLDSLNLYESHKRNLAGRTREKEEARKRLDDLQEAIASSDVTADLGANPDAVEMIRESIGRLQSLRNALGAAKKSFSEARAEEERLERSYSWLGVDPMQHGLEEKLEALRRTAQSCESVLGGLVLARQKVEALKENAPSEAGCQEPEKRLAQKASDERAVLRALGGRGAGPLIYWFCAGSVLVGTIISVAAASWIPFALASGLAAAVLLLRGASPKVDLPKDTATRLGVGKPSANECFALLEKLRSEMRALEEAIRFNAASSRAKLALDEEKRKFLLWEAGHKEAAAALGINIDSASFERSCFFNFSSELIAWRQASGKRARIEGELGALEKEEADEAERLRAFLGEESKDALIIKANRMIRALDAHAKAKDEQARLSKTLKALGEAEDGARRSLKRFWEAVGLDEGDEAKLGRMVGELEAYDGLLSQINHLKAETTPSEDIKGLLGMELEDLRAEASALEGRIKKIEDSKIECGSLEQKHNDLISSKKLAEAKTALEEAEDGLLAKWEENAIALGVGIVERCVEEESSRIERPDLLSRASSWLLLFTDGRHDVRFRQSKLISHDYDKGRDYEVGELSSGTRVQLLIALRLASIEFAEQGTAYPVFFDEVMANSDDARAGNLADAIAKISKDRQVFYFTAQDDEVQRLVSCCEKTGADLAIVDLVSKTSSSKPRIHREKAKKQWSFDCPYSFWMVENNVPSGSLFSEVPSLPSWFLFFNTEDLEACLDKGLEKIRQVSASASYKNSEAAKIAQALEAVRVRALKGRAKPVTGDVLNDFQPPNRKAGYWKEIMAYVEEVKAVDGAALVREIEAGIRFKRVGSSFVEQLRRFLIENGHIATEEREDEALILDRLQQAGAGGNEIRAAKRYLELFNEL